jgi:hypothetical protein
MRFSWSIFTFAFSFVLLSWFRQQICHRGRGMAVCGGGVNTEERSGMVVARVYPASGPATAARPYVLL